MCSPCWFLKASSPFSLRVPVQLDTTVLDQAMAKLMVEELAHVSSTWWQTYMSTVEHDVLEKVNLLGCTEWDPKDQWEAWSILKECTDVFAKSDLGLGMNLHHET